MKKVDKPWGYEHIFAETDSYVGKVLFVREGSRLSKQYHEIKDETILLYDGSIKLLIENGEDKEEWVMEEGESYRIRKGVIHRMTALEDSHIFEVSTPELDDVVRLEDDYGRNK